MTTSTQADITPFKKEFWTELRNEEKMEWALKNHPFLKGVQWGIERFQEIDKQLNPLSNPEDDDGTDESGMDSLNESGMDGLVSPYSQTEAVDPLTGETADVDAVGNSDPSDLLNETPYPWEKWAQLPRIEREAETKEAAKNNEAVGGHFFDTGGGEFNSNPETLSPINLDSALVTDAYQQQDAPGADLIAGEANQEMDPSQAQREQYEVLA